MLGYPIRAKDLPCKYLESRSGGTRTRTGDTMIFSHRSTMLVSIAVSADLPYLGVFQHFLRCYLPVEYRLVPAGLQYGCSKLPWSSF